LQREERDSIHTPAPDAGAAPEILGTEVAPGLQAPSSRSHPEIEEVADSVPEGVATDCPLELQSLWDGRGRTAAILEDLYDSSQAISVFSKPILIPESGPVRIVLDPLADLVAEHPWTPFLRPPPPSANSFAMPALEPRLDQSAQLVRAVPDQTFTSGVSTGESEPIGVPHQLPEVAVATVHVPLAVFLPASPSGMSSQAAKFSASFIPVPWSPLPMRDLSVPAEIDYPAADQAPAEVSLSDLLNGRVEYTDLDN
jgi:hypothetical protein